MNFSVLFAMIVFSVATMSQASSVPTPTPVPTASPMVPFDDTSVTFVPVETSSHELMAKLPKQLYRQSRPATCGDTYTATNAPRCTSQTVIGRISHLGRFGTTWITFQQIRGAFRVGIIATGTGAYINAVGAAVTMDSRAPSFGSTIFSRTQAVTSVAGNFNSRSVPVNPRSSFCCFSDIFVHISINQCFGASCSPRRQSFSTSMQCGSPC